RTLSNSPKLKNTYLAVVVDENLPLAGKAARMLLKNPPTDEHSLALLRDVVANLRHPFRSEAGQILQQANLQDKTNSAPQNGEATGPGESNKTEPAERPNEKGIPPELQKRLL